MIKLKKIFTNNPKLIISLFLFILTTILTFVVNNIHYLSTESPDYSHLKIYLNYFFSETDVTNRDLGLLYFNIVSFSLNLLKGNINYLNEHHIISNAIQVTNYFLYLFGLIGLYKLLRFKEYNSENILFGFAVLNFFPQTINLLLTMKPEILAFSLFTWVMYLLEKFLDGKDVKYIYFTILPLAIILNTKGSIFFFSILILGFILLTNYKFFLKKELAIPLVAFLFLFLLLSFENYKVNGFSIFDHVSSSLDGSYKNVANLSILYNINFSYLITQPFSNFHADSLIGIILLDTFGDYFNFWAFNDESLFYINPIKIQQIWFITHFKQFFSIILTTAFYFLLFFNIKKDKKNNIYFLAPIFALVLLVINAFGIPIKNFNPASADTFKTHYYSYLLIFSFIFIFLNLVKKNEKFKYISLILIFSSSFYLYGFPKEMNSSYYEYLNLKNSVSVTCKLNSKIIRSLDDSYCENVKLQTCFFNRIVNNSDALQNKRLITEDYDYFVPVDLVDVNQNIKTARNSKECTDYLDSGYKAKKPLQGKLIINKLNIIYYLVSLLSLIFISKSESK